MANAKIQHYVPQFLLRNFGNGKKDQVWVYDKLSNRSFASNAKNVASENRFYDFEYKEQQLSIEPWLSKLENRAKLAIEGILKFDSSSTISDDHRLVMAEFLAVQLVRTKTFREEWIEFPKMLREHFLRSGDQVASGSQAEKLLRDLSKNESKEQTSKMVVDAPKMYAQHFLDKDWALIATTKRVPFFLNDNPLVRQNMLDSPHRGNLGLTSPGIEIYFPLSPTRALALWCPTLTNLVHRDASQRISSCLPDPEGIIGMSASLRSGVPLQFSPENVENLNSLQVTWSERYIFSTVDNFELARSMLEVNPRLRKGPRSFIA
jgi:hypothetical protein